MKITGNDTRVILIAPGEWVEVRGAGAECAVRSRAGVLTLYGLTGEQYESLTGKRVLILELAE